jgi:uronate dehydrogenase
MSGAEHGLIAITGAAGLVGTGLRKQLRERGYRLVLLDRKPVTDCTESEQSFLVDITDQTAVTRHLQGCDAVVHLAACTTDAPWAEQVTLSVEGSISLFEAARAAGVMRVIYASSHHVVGYHPRTTVLDEHAVLKPDSRYGVGKAFGESIGAMMAYKYDMRVLSIRIGNVNSKPIDRRRLGNWISWRDLGQLVSLGITHPELRYEVVYGISDATGRDYDNRAAHALGYRPQDQSEPFEADVLAHDPVPAQGSPQAFAPSEMTKGGVFSGNEFTGSSDRLRTWSSHRKTTHEHYARSDHPD